VSETPIRVLIVDDHGVVRRGLVGYLALFDDLQVVGEAADGAAALRAIRSLATGGGGPPDVVLMDLAMEPIDGVAATRAVRREWPAVEVVAVTSFIEEARVHAALAAGASGYVIKDAAPEEIALAIRAAHRGEVHLDAAVARRLMASLRPSGVEDPFGDLTEREREILALVAQGQSNKEIALQLAISERTARTHVSNILAKLGVASRTQAALLAVREGLGEASGPSAA
jgi:DNA-binding NarL/FixJ family response regulator